MIRISLILTAFLLSVSLYSQTNVPITRSQFKVKGKEGVNEAWKEIKDGNFYYIKGKGAYYLAKEHYKKAFEYNSSLPELNYKLGISLLLSDEKTQAKKYLELAYQVKPDLTKDIEYFLARAYHMANDFDSAIVHYSKYKSGLSKMKFKKIGGDIDSLIVQCNHGKQMVNNPVRAIIENMGPNINSIYDDYTPIISGNDSLFLFTSRRMHSLKSKIHPLDYKYYESIYYTKKNMKQWGSANMLFFKKKVKKNLAVTGVSKDGNTIYLYKGSKRKGDIYYSTFYNNKWKKPKSIGSKVNSRKKEGSMAISPDGSTLYFISEKRKGVGGSDIYISRKIKSDKWEKPVNAGIVNTPYDESSISIHPNGEILYFSSQGHQSMGGFDIFQCDIAPTGDLSNVQNVGYPINSSTDDQYYIPAPVGKAGYVSTIRENTLGASDIYKITFLGKEKEFEAGVNEMKLVGLPGIDKNIFFEQGEKIEFKPVSLYELTGSIIDAETKGMLEGSVQLIEEATKNGIDKVSSNLMGKFVVTIPKPTKYIIKVLSNGYMPYSEDIDFSKIFKQERIITLEKIKVGSKMIMKNIYFDSGKASLKKESNQELENVYSFLLDNPSIKIEIAGYTDNIGSVAVNNKLSKLRAKACVDYLIKKGIDSDRLQYEGYGFLNPIADNKTAAGRSQNRRVEFKILEN